MPKRTASNAFPSPRRSRSLSPLSRRRATRSPSAPSPTTQIHGAPARLESRMPQSNTPSNPSEDIFLEDELVDEDEDPLLYRILTGFEYTLTQHAQGRPVMQTSRLQISTQQHQASEALSVLRQAGRDGHATLIAVDDEYEIWDFGVPRPDWVAEGALGGVHDPQWWVGLDAAQIKAGPGADAADVKRASATLKGKETRRNKRSEKSQRVQESNLKLREWHRKFKGGENMNDSDGSDTDRSRFAPEAGDDDSADDDDSDDGDDEPNTPEYTARWKAKRQSRAAVARSTTSSRRQSVSSDESDGYVPPSSSDTEPSDSKLPRSDSGIDLRSKSRKKGSSSESETASDSADNGPLVPVFSKWKAAQKARHAGSDANTVTKR